MVQPSYRVASAGQAEPWEETMHEAGERAKHHATAKAESHTHVLQVGFVDGGGVVGESANHSQMLALLSGNGLQALYEGPQN